MKYAQINTVADLKKALKSIPDETTIESFGPDSGGYDVTQTGDVILSFDNKRVFIGGGDSDNKHVWDKVNGNIIGRVYGLPVYLDSIKSTMTIDDVNLAIKNGADLELKLYEK